jgi:NACalpha-BTF3-like transcription factor
MTTKEIAEAVNKTERCVRNWVTKIAEKSSVIAEKSSVSSPMNPADYNIEETCHIIETGLGKNASNLYRMNAKNKPLQNDKVSSILSERDIAIISQIVSVTVSETIKALDGRMANLEHKIEQRQALLPAPQIDPRNHIVKLVTDHVSKTGQEFRDVYNTLYREYGYRTHCNASLTAKNRNMKIIDYIDSEGQIEILESIAMEIFK